MSHRKDQSNRPPNPDPSSDPSGGDPRGPREDRNAFAPFFLDHMARREPVPTAP
jgi:hypothetical protein